MDARPPLLVAAAAAAAVEGGVACIAAAYAAVLLPLHRAAALAWRQASIAGRVGSGHGVVEGAQMMKGAAAAAADAAAADAAGGAGGAAAAAAAAPERRRQAAPCCLLSYVYVERVEESVVVKCVMKSRCFHGTFPKEGARQDMMLNVAIVRGGGSWSDGGTKEQGICR